MDNHSLIYGTSARTLHKFSGFFLFHFDLVKINPKKKKIQLSWIYCALLVAKLVVSSFIEAFYLFGEPLPESLNSQRSILVLQRM
jgi:hypothetical protein